MYDTAFGSMKTKSLMYDMVEFSRSIRELHSLAYSLPRVAKRWHPEELEDIVYNHLIHHFYTMISGRIIRSMSFRYREIGALN